jgi:hypothetical protein
MYPTAGCTPSQGKSHRLNPHRATIQACENCGLAKAASRALIPGKRSGGGHPPIPVRFAYGPIDSREPAGARHCRNTFRLGGTRQSSLDAVDKIDPGMLIRLCKASLVAATRRLSGWAVFTSSISASRVPAAPLKLRIVQSGWSPLAVDPRAGRMRTLSPLRIGRPGNSTFSGTCRSKLSPKGNREDRTLNSSSMAAPKLGSLALTLAIRSVRRDTATPLLGHATGHVIFVLANASVGYVHAIPPVR